MSPRLLFVDHRDSFSGNLVAMLRALGFAVRVMDDADLPRYAGAMSALLRRADGLVLSPGPGHPSDYPRSRECYFLARKSMPVLGVCLGLQIVLHSHGGGVERISTLPVHGRREYLVGNYPSLWAREEFLGAPWVFFNSLGCRADDPVFADTEWKCVARTGDHAAWVESAVAPILLTQFHLESFGSPQGERFLREWLGRHYGCAPAP